MLYTLRVSAEFLGVIRPSYITMEISVPINGVTSYVVQDFICPCIKYAVFGAHNDLITPSRFQDIIDSSYLVS